MKTRIITVITLLTVVLGISVSNAATRINDRGAIAPVSVATHVINKIEVSGNVEVYVTNGDKDQVKVCDKYYAKNALVQNQDGVLRITSYSTDKLVVMVTVTDLKAITANDNSIVKSFGKLSLVDLDLVLNNRAAAQLNLDAISAKVTLNNRATADISGSIINYESAYSQSSTLNKTKLTAFNSIENNTTKAATVRQAQDRIASL